MVFIYSAKDILNLEIISTEEAEAKESQTQSKVTVKRPIAKRANRSVSECIPSSVPVAISQPPTNLKKPVEPSIPEPSANGKVGPGNKMKTW